MSSRDFNFQRKCLVHSLSLSLRNSTELLWRRQCAHVLAHTFRAHMRSRVGTVLYKLTLSPLDLQRSEMMRERERSQKRVRERRI